MQKWNQEVQQAREDNARLTEAFLQAFLPHLDPHTLGAMTEDQEPIPDPPALASSQTEFVVETAALAVALRAPLGAPRAPEQDMQRYRVEVGHRDRVKPGNLVGAIAGETGLQGRRIGRIQIFDNHSLVDLPKGMPEDVFNNLRRLRVMNRELQISQAS